MDTKALERQFVKENIYVCLINQHGVYISKYYKAGEEKGTLYKINSITKSIMATLIGIAIDKGYIASVHTPIKQFFPNLPQNKQMLTIYHLLTMTTGEDWQEFGNGVKFPTFFVRSKHWTNYVLKRPTVEQPGVKMNYNSGSSHVLSYILQSTTGLSAAQFAKEHLFEPLGITHYEWEQDPQGIYIGGFGMRMTAEDLLQIGLLYLQKGKWRGMQLVSSSWIQEACQAKFTTYEHIGSYGFHWWVLDKKRFDVPFSLYFAMGYGGRYLIVVPELELVVVISSHMPKKGLVPLRLFIDWLKKYYKQQHKALFSV